MNPLTPKQLEDVIEGFRKEYEEAPERIAAVLRQPRADWPFIPVRTGWGGELFVAGMLTSEAGGDRVRLTQDGHPCMGETWSTASGDLSGEDVYFETWDLEFGRRTSHGYVDAVTRYLVQSG